MFLSLSSCLSHLCNVSDVLIGRQEHWWAVMLISAGVIIVMGLFIKVFSYSTPSEDPEVKKQRERVRYNITKNDDRCLTCNRLIDQSLIYLPFIFKTSSLLMKHWRKNECFAQRHHGPKVKFEKVSYHATPATVQNVHLHSP